MWNCKNNDVAENGYIYTVIDKIRYGIKDGVASVVRNAQNISGEIVIPSTIMYKNTAYSVTSIGSSAFSSCHSLTSMVIPNTVTSIGGGAFEWCSSLTIYCEAESQPSGWDSSWNSDNCTVVWGYKG